MNKEFYKLIFILTSWTSFALLGDILRQRHQLMHDLVSAPTKNFKPVMGYQVLVFPTKKRLQALPLSIRRRSRLAALSLHHSLTNKPRLYDLGVLDKRNHNQTVFVALRKDIPNWDRMYWVMMRVLAKEYSCMMLKRKKSASGMQAFCKDGRGVSLHQYSGGSWLGFDAVRLSRKMARHIFNQNKSNHPSGRLQKAWLATRRELKASE
ncbi:MAG: hypothetical protein AB8C84_05315 [Oligoflexales bacterium]